jgi:Putative homoserine kinase type II (protein kinase fold)
MTVSESPAALGLYTEIARLALAAWGLERETALKLVKLRENAVFAVGINIPRYVLRIHRRGYHTDGALRSELQWMTVLGAHGIATPKVIPTTGGDLIARVELDIATAYQCDLLAWVSGQPLGTIEQQTTQSVAVNERAYYLLGREAGKVHRHGEVWQPGPQFQRHRWDEEGCLGKSGNWGYFGDLPSLNERDRSLLIRAADLARKRLAVFGKSGQRFGLIHGDLVPENVLIEGERCTLIDFDDSGFGWFAYEIANAVFFLCGSDSFAPALAALVRGYRAERELTDEDLDMLDVMLFMRGAAVLAWLHTRRETELWKAIEPYVTDVTRALATRLTGARDSVGVLETTWDTLQKQNRLPGGPRTRRANK